MVKDGVFKTLAGHAMADAAIGAGDNVIIRLAFGIDTVVAVMAASTGLYTGIDQTMVKYTITIEGACTMTNAAINGHDRMTFGHTPCMVAVMTAGTVFTDRTVVDEGRFEIIRSVTIAAISLSYEMPLLFTRCKPAVVTPGTVMLDTGVVIFTVSP